MSMSPLVSAATTETQFADGTTTFSHSFTSATGGDAQTPGITLPYGASVTQARFSIEGTAQNTQWENRSTNSEFGGAGTTSTSFTGTYFSSWYRNNLKVENDEITLNTQESTNTNNLAASRDWDSASSSYHNTTGRFAANGDQGYISPTISSNSMTVPNSMNWNYPGALVKIGNTLFTSNYQSSSVYQTPAINSYNSSSSSVVNSVTKQYNSCNSQALYTLYDLAADGEDTVWAVSYNYRRITKWTVSDSTWSCVGDWTMSSSSSYPVGIAIDPETDDLKVLVRSSSGSITYNLWNVSRSNPTTATSITYLGTSSTLSGTISGLTVNYPRIMVNSYRSSSSTHFVLHNAGAWVDFQGSITLNGKGHYGIADSGEGEVLYACFYTAITSYCPSTTSRTVLSSGMGATFEQRSSTQSNSIAIGSTTNLGSSISTITLSGLITYEPDGTSVEVEVSLDGGNSWKSASLNTQISFTNGGNQVKWRAYLNGTNNSISPIIDRVQLTYVSSYSSSGYIRGYKYLGTTGTSPVAAKVWWNSTTPGSSYFNMYFQVGSQYTVQSPGQTISLTGTSSYIYFYIYFYSGSGGTNTPTLEDFNIQIFSQAPQNVKMDIGDDGSNEWQEQGTLLGIRDVSNTNILNSINSQIPGTGVGTVTIPITLSSTAPGLVKINSFELTYTMQTVNLDIIWEDGMVLHERSQAYEVVTRHVIGEGATGISGATLDFVASPNSDSPSLTWSETGTLMDDDPADWIIPIQPGQEGGTYTTNNNGIFEIHWRFRVTSEFPEQNNVGFRVTCTDDQGSTPAMLSDTMNTGIIVNQSYGLGWLGVRDAEGLVTSQNLTNGAWISAGETIFFQGQMWFANTEDTPLNSVFDVQIAQKGEQGDFVQSSWKDQNNPDGSFFISLTVPEIDIPEGITYEVQTYNERDSTLVIPPGPDSRRTFFIDGTSPEITHNMPKQDDYVAARYDQSIIIDVEDAVGDPKELTLHYWVEADHDINRNGIADSDEYVNRSMVNTTTAESKRFFTTIDDSRNPNLASVSYYVTGNDPAGNLLESGEGPGFSSDLATYRTRKDMESVFTGLHWSGHNDGDAIFAGTEQTITAGLVDANGIIDFEIISLIFDFEGPDPERDKQSISFSGRNNTFWSDSDYIDILQNSKATTISNDTGLPWILIDFHFKVSWDWPDEDISDLAFEYKQLGASMRRIEFVDRTFHVENDLVLDPTSYTITDVMHPRVGPIDSSTSIRADDRIQWTGRVVYENSQTPPPNNLGIVVEVFDGVQMWSDGSLTENGDYMIEVPLSAAPTLASAETRTFLTGITGIPGRGEDMTRDSVSTTLQLSVDHTPPRVIHRILPVDIIDIGIQEDLTQVNVAFLGTEECVNDPSDQRCSDLAQAPQQVHWIMRDGTTTIAAGYSVLSMELQGNLILWTGTVDLTSGGLVIPRSGYIVGFYVTGEDAAGNTFPQTSNSESDPVREPTNLDNDLDLAWVTLGADKSPELRAIRIDTNQERVSVGTDVELRMYLTNLGGPLNASFDVSFFAGDATEPFNTQRIDKIEEGDTIYIDAIWDAEEGIERIRVVVDSSDEIDEIDEQDNAISVGIDVAYGWGLGWIEQARQNPLTILLIVIALIVVPTVTYVSIRQMNKGAVDDDFVNLLFEDDQYEDDDDEYDDDEYDDDDGGWE